MYFLLAFYFYKKGRFWIYFLILSHKTIFLCRTKCVEKIVETVPMDAP